MQTKNKSPINRARLLVGIFVVAALILVVIVLYRGSRLSTQQVSQMIYNKQSSIQDTKHNVTPTNDVNPKQTNTLRNITTTPTENSTAINSSDSSQMGDGEKKQKTNPSELGCSTETNQICTIKNDDQIYLVLGQNPDTELLLNGVKIKPKKITYQLTPATYDDEQMKDGAGKVLTSSMKKHDPVSGVLQLLVGANPDYYKSLTYSQKKLLYVSQTVRTFMAMFGETPDNYVKVEKVVNSLGSWQPSP